MIRRHDSYRYFCGGILLLLLLLFFCGCAADSHKMAEENVCDTVTEPPEIITGSPVLEDDRFLYVCTQFFVNRIEKQTGEEKNLWQVKGNMGTWLDDTAFFNAAAVLVDDRIFFLEKIWDHVDNESGYERTQYLALSEIGTDGTGYRRLLSFNTGSSVRNLYLIDGALYVESWYAEGPQLFYTIGENGALDRNYHPTIELIDAARELERQHDAIDPYSVDVDALADEESWIEARYRIYGDDAMLYYVDVTDDGRRIFKFYEQETGRVTELFERSFEKTLQRYDAIYSFLSGDAIYYVIQDDYAYYLARRKLTALEKEERIGSAFYDRGIGKVGELLHLEKEYKASVGDPQAEVTYARGDVFCLQVDERYAGADRINTFLQERYQRDMDAFLPDAEEYRMWSETEPVRAYYSRLEEITYLDNGLVSFGQNGWASPGNTDSRYWEDGYTFDLETGERLELTDIVSDDAGWMGYLLATYLTDQLERDLPDWSAERIDKEIVQKVRDRFTMAVGWYLRPEGLVLICDETLADHYTLLTRDVVIPYEKLHIKREL